MKKIILITYLFFISCDTSNECGDIVDKYVRDGKYFFTLTRGNSNNNNSEGGGQAEVTKETYESFSVGQEYCLE